MGTSEVPSREMSRETDGVWEGGCEGTKDQGEGPSGLTLVDKGKGKERRVKEETLQEE